MANDGMSKQDAVNAFTRGVNSFSKMVACISMHLSKEEILGCLVGPGNTVPSRLRKMPKDALIIMLTTDPNWVDRLPADKKTRIVRDCARG